MHSPVVLPVANSVRHLGDVGALGPTDCFGEMALLSNDGKRNATITTTSPALLVSLNKDAYDSLLHMAHKRETQTKLAFINSLTLFNNVSKVSRLNPRPCGLRSHVTILPRYVFRHASYNYADCLPSNL